MPTSRPRPDAAAGAAQAGFTRVELMVVIAIIGVAAGAVVLNMPASDISVRRAAEALAVDVAALRDHAIVTGRRTVLTADAHGFVATERRGGRDRPVADRHLAGQSWPGGIAATGAARIAFDPTGIADGGAILLRARDDGASARIVVATDGRIDVAH